MFIIVTGMVPWTMRFEAKHSYFKQLARSLGNFINHWPHDTSSISAEPENLPNSVDVIQVRPGIVNSISFL